MFLFKIKIKFKLKYFKTYFVQCAFNIKFQTNFLIKF